MESIKREKRGFLVILAKKDQKRPKKAKKGVFGGFQGGPKKG